MAATPLPPVAPAPVPNPVEPPMSEAARIVDRVAGLAPWRRAIAEPALRRAVEKMGAA